MHPILEQFIDFSERQDITDSAFIVGGAVRDILLGKELKDIDIAIKGDALNIARRFAEEINGSYVLLDKEFGIARIVKNSQFLDISIMRGDSIYTDLSERDITINAMALPLSAVDSQQSAVSSSIDPYDGKNDLLNKIIRMVSEENLIKDPLRILRIYRFAAVLNFSIYETTLDSAKRLAALITSVAAERIAEELRCIVRLDDSYKTITAMKDNGVLLRIFPEIKESNLELYKAVEEILNNPYDSLWPSAFSLQPLIEYFKPDYRKICLKLSVIFHDSGTAKQAAIRLKMSRKEVESIRDMTFNRGKILSSYRETSGALHEITAVKLLKQFHEDIYALAILAMAQEPSITPFCRELLGFYEHVFKPRAALLPVITGDDLVKEFNLKPSPLFKKILTAIEDMVLEGKINSTKEALKAVGEMLSL